MNSIAELSRQNARDRSAETAQKLLELRLAAGKALFESSRSGGIAQAGYTDLWPDESGLVEVDGAQLNTETLASGLRHHGALLVRGLYTQQQLDRLNVLARDQEAANRGDTAPLGCSARTLFDMLEIYRECGLLAAITPYLDGEPLMFGERAKLRHHRAEHDRHASIPWHQDVNFFNMESRGVNCWAAVTPCGKDNPGLDVIPFGLNERFGWDGEQGFAPLDYGRTMPADILDRLMAKHPPVQVALDPGDALLFDEMTMHQTGSRPWRLEGQIVTISWFFRASGFPTWGTPVAV